MEIDLTNLDLEDGDSPLPSPSFLNKNSSKICIDISSDSDSDAKKEIYTNTNASPSKTTNRRVHSISLSEESDRDGKESNENEMNCEEILLPASDRLGNDVSPFGQSWQNVLTTNENDRIDVDAEDGLSNYQKKSYTLDEEISQNNDICEEDSQKDQCFIFTDDMSNDIHPVTLGGSTSDNLLNEGDLDGENVTKKKKTIKNSSAKKLARELKEKKRAELQEARARKVQAKLEKQMAKEKEKLMKKIEAEKLKSSTPGECIKNFKVLMDPRFLDLPEGPVLLSLLQSLEISYETHDQPVPCSITWTRKRIDSQLNEKNEIEKAVEEFEEQKVINVVPLEKFLLLVHNFKEEQKGINAEETLLNYIDTIKEKFPGKNLTLIVKGCEQYFRNEKNKHQRNYRQNVLGYEESQKKQPKRKRAAAHSPQVTELDVEECIIALQIHRDCNIVMVESTAELAANVIAYSKALAVAPYKQEKAQSEGFLWMMSNTKTNSISDSGEGLLSVWQKQIQEFPSASEEAAKAIVSQYPSPFVLVQAFKDANKEKGEKCLQNIEVRRGAGPLASKRRVGPELSRKIFHCLTSLNPELNLNAK